MKTIQPFTMLDIETLGTPRDCGTSFIAMPWFAFVHFKDWDTLPVTIVGATGVQSQISSGAAVSSSTVSFWLNEALKGNPAAANMAELLSSDKAYLHTNLSLDLFDSEFVQENTVFEGTKYLLDKLLPAEANIPVYGNGPEFDLTIYESVLVNLGFSKEVPWNYRNPSSARELKSLYSEAGNDYRELQADSAVWAKQIMETDNYYRGYFGSPVLHDPLFDALAETYVVAKIKEYFLNK